MKRPDVSIVIPALNEEKRIGDCLEALARQKTRHTFEVIVVDNGSTDSTSKIAKSFGDRMNITVLREIRRGRGRARRTGFLKARGKYFLSTDADTIVPPNWIDAFLTYFRKNPKMVAATGLPQIVDCDEQTNRIFNAVIPYVLSGNFLVHGHPGMSGFSCAVRADVYRKAGGFDPNADAYEDLDLSRRVGAIGKIGMIKAPRVTFSGRRFKHGLMHGCMEYALPYLQVFLLGRESAILPPVNESGKRKRETEKMMLSAFKKLLAIATSNKVRKKY